MRSARTTRPRLAAALASLALAAAGTAISTSAAHAAAGDLTCTLNLTVAFDPPLTAIQRTTTATGSGILTNCLSPNGTHSDLTSSYFTGAGSITASPGLSAFHFTGSAAYTFNNNSTGDFSFDVNTDPRTPNFKGAFTDGPLSGDTGAGAAAAIVPDGNPVTGVTGFTVTGAVVTFG